ncbi:hypothetical protein ACFVDI_26275 [Nocardioides sp. NPDC057767]|uniref:hypothetical protein n=1 Tax=unclassified Nocardioides TaxID=2615069 RepID=UPI00366F1D38
MTTRLPDDAPKLGRYVALGIVLVAGALACLIQVGTLKQFESKAPLDPTALQIDLGAGSNQEATASGLVYCASLADLQSAAPSADGYVDGSDSDDVWRPTGEAATEISRVCASRRAATAAKIAVYAGGGGFLGALGIGLLLTCHLLRVNFAPKRE